MAQILTNGHQGMRFSDDEDGEVQSGSATGFSDVEPVGEPVGHRRMTRLTDPVTQILDKIDAELVSLTRSQGSTATTATDSTVVHKPDGRSSMESSVMENGEGLSISQLGLNFKPSMMSSRAGTSDHDTGIGTSSIQDHSLQHRSLEPEVRPLEPGDSFRAESPRMKSPTRQVTTPNIFLNGQHLSDDDKQRQENQSTSAAPFEAKQVDDKFKEILQKRKGILKYPTRHKSPAPSCDPFDLRYKGGMMRMSADEDTQTIRTEDFVDKFQDTMVYSSADEAERIRNLDDDLHSDGGSDTDTLQRKLAILTRTPVPKSRTNKESRGVLRSPVRSNAVSSCLNYLDGRTSPRPLTRPMIERAKGKFASPYEMRPKKVPGPGTPPVYPKPTPTTSLPRPSARSTIKFAPGHASDADSVKTEDFENKFREMGMKKEESDLESVSNDPIHTKVKQLLKATSKYKPAKSEYKPKHHVRISPQPAQYDKGEDSDDTLCSEKQRVASPRSHEDHRPSQPDDEVEVARREIARESDKIRREMERERRAKSMSPLRERSPTRTYLTLTQSPKTLYDKGDRPRPHSPVHSSVHAPVHSAVRTNVHSSIPSTFHPPGSGGGGKSLSDEEKERTAELKATQNALDVTQSALDDARKDLKQIQAQYDDVRTQLMLSEYKRENTSKELTRLSTDVQRKQAEAKNLDSQTKTRREELEQFDAIGFTKDEAVHIIEENEKMKSRLRSLDAVHAERDELIQQLESAKQELFTEQKRARTRIEELKEELETATCSHDQTLTEKDDVAKKLQKLDAAYKKMEKEKNELIQEKSRQYEEERNKLKTEKNEWRKRSYDEVDGIRQDLIRMTNRVAGLQDEVKSKEELNYQLRSQILSLEEKIDQEKTSRTSILEEHKKTLQTLRKDTDSALVQMRESLFLEKQKTIDAMREDLEQERREIASRSEERYIAKLAEQDAIIKKKKEKIASLSKYVDKIETDMTRTKVKMDDELKMQVQEAVNKERMSLEREKDWAVQQEKDKMEREHKDKVKHIQEEMARMLQEQRCLRASMKDQGSELDDLKNSNKSAMHEKLVAVARAKELMRQEHMVELDRIKEQLKNEHKKEVDKLRETIRLQEVELRNLKEDQLRYMRHQKEFDMSHDRTERTLINEINEECRKTSDILGLSPRKVTLNTSQNNIGSSKSATNAALANLRACNEELRMHVTDLQHDIEVQRNTLNIADREKDEALATLKRQLEREKEEEMARLKERLVRGMSTNEYRSLLYTPDNDVAANRQSYEPKPYPNERHLRQVSEQQQEDLQRLEREINKLAMNGGTGLQDDVDYSKGLARLQSKVKQLQMDNTNLRRAKLNVSSSSPDLTVSEMYASNHRKFSRPVSPTRDQQRMASTLELRAREHDYETAALTNHQRRNRDIMSKKMAEMSKLQNTLTNQAKELIQLEKSYTQLNQHAKASKHTIR